MSQWKRLEPEILDAIISVAVPHLLFAQVSVKNFRDVTSRLLPTEA
jgi:hypothetical protein